MSSLQSLEHFLILSFQFIPAPFFALWCFPLPWNHLGLGNHLYPFPLPFNSILLSILVLSILFTQPIHCCSFSSNSIKNFILNFLSLLITPSVLLLPKSSQLKMSQVKKALLTQWSTVLLGRLIVPKLVNKFHTFYGMQSSFPCSQQPTTHPCPQPDKSSPHPPILYLLGTF